MQGAPEPELPDEQPLWIIALSVAPPELVAELWEAARVARARYDEQRYMTPFRTAGEFMRLAAEQSARAYPTRADPIDQRHFAAGQAVSNILRAKAAAGEIVLKGLRVKPTLQECRTAVPRAWISYPSLRFVWEAGRIRFREFEFDKVTGSLLVVENVEADPGKRRGRPAFPLAEFVDIAASVPRQKGREREAEALMKAYRARHPLTPLLSLNNLTNRVNEIYDLAGKSAPSV